ncbi:putative 3-hydroxyisobutyrate dehydrogenase-like 1 [Nymphaea thermarum]|nr:putative 3-hydroxyisobutyrate dehydrogenase-like 1 [Nymphaea thermarum]
MSIPEIVPGRTRVGWVGTGVMGAAMAARLQAAGFALTVYARTPEKARCLEAAGACLVGSLAEVGRSSDVIITIVSRPADVREVILGEAGILAALRPPGIVVDMTSSQPALAREIAALARAKGCWAVDAPVSGGDVGAKEGTLAIFAAGDGTVVDALRPLLGFLGKVWYVGEAGKGQSCKIANQITVGATMMGVSEGFHFASHAGLDPAQFMGAVGAGAGWTKVGELFGSRIVQRDFEPGGMVEYMVKDLGLAMEEEDGQPAVVLPGAALFRQIYTAMVAQGNGKMGLQGVVTVLERLNGK